MMKRILVPVLLALSACGAEQTEETPPDTLTCGIRGIVNRGFMHGRMDGGHDTFTKH